MAKIPNQSNFLPKIILLIGVIVLAVMPFLREFIPSLSAYYSIYGVAVLIFAFAFYLKWRNDKKLRTYVAKNDDSKKPKKNKEPLSSVFSLKNWVPDDKPVKTPPQVHGPEKSDEEIRRERYLSDESEG